MASNLDLINDADGFPYQRDAVKDLYSFKVAGVNATLGYVLPSVSQVLSCLPGWQVDDTHQTVLLEGGQNVDDRSAAIKQSLLAMREKGSFSILQSWRDETFPIFGPRREVVLHIERCACPLFGVVTYGVHAVAYVPPLEPGQQLKIWIPRRARSKQTFGGMLDSSAAGGIASGDTPFETLVRECEEEASLPSELVRRHAKAAGTVTNFYIRDHRSGGEVGLLQPECQYVFDLPLPPVVICQPNDGEVEDFRLWNVDEIMEGLAKREFKPNCALVMLDFFVRHGILSSENEKDYLEIVWRLHRRLEFPLR